VRWDKVCLMRSSCLSTELLVWHIANYTLP
jgi:hypothetical protein